MSTLQIISSVLIFITHLLRTRDNLANGTETRAGWIKRTPFKGHIIRLVPRVALLEIDVTTREVPEENVLLAVDVYA